MAIAVFGLKFTKSRCSPKLFNWLDGNDRFFQQLLNKHRRKGIVLAISAEGNLAHLPWELLHDGKSFLVERKPGIIPVRWMSSDINQQLTIKPQPENRALQMLFMATSPLNVKPILDFEKEEASILSATARQPLTLTVEESGCLEELGYLVEDYGKSYFDVLHLTGHATIKDETPAFITESATGEAVESTADDIASELQFQLPKLIFLSGCRTGQAGNSGAVPSMAESLLDKGATSVLGWGQKVLDTDATAAAAALYQALSSGKLLTEALALTYQTLIQNNARDWHLLRLYVRDTLPGNLVTSLRTRGRKPAAPRSFNAGFLDAAGKVKVPTRESFVGRRRQLQSCLRTLINPSSEEIGVLIHGMGGLGKSSLAARLCDRLINFQRVVWVEAIDEASLVNRLTEKLDSQTLRKTLQNPDEELKFRLKRVFNLLRETGDKPFLLVLDDFEANLEPRNDSYILQPEAARVLSALVWAINATDKFQRVIITCRYDFESSYLQQFYKQPLEGMHGADLRKKLNRLAAFNQDNKKSQVDETLKTKAQQLADGNPRLLEWLDKLLLSNVDVAAILNKLEVDSGELREQVLAEELLQQMDNTMREMLQLGLVFELPVPREALEVVCENIADLGRYIDKAIALGLLEVSPDELLRVPRILPLEFSHQDSDTDNVNTVIATKGSNREIFKIAARVLYRLWWEDKETYIEEEALEIHRLGLSGRETEIAAKIAGILGSRWINQSRFREAVKLCKSTLDITEDYRVLHNLAYSEAELGDVELAEQHYQQALELCPQEDEKEKATIIHNFADIYTRRGDVDEAIALYQQSFDLYERIGDVQGKAASLNEIAIIFASRGDVDEAIALYQQCLDLEERIGNVQGKAASLHQLAGIYTRRVDVDEAITLYQQSFDLYERIGNVQGKAASLHQLAMIYARRGDVDQAIALYQQELEERIGDVQGKADSLHQLAMIYARRADVHFDLDERIGNVQGKAASLHNLAIIYARRGDVDEAIALYQQSLDLYERIGNVRGKAASLHQLAGIYARRGDVDEAIALYQQSLELDERIGDVQGKAASLHQLAGLYARRGDVDEAIALYQQSLELFERIGNVQGKAASLHQLAGIYARRGDVDEAITLYQQSLELKERIGYVQGKAITLAMLGKLLADVKQDFTTALDYLQQSLEILLHLQSPDAETVGALIFEVLFNQLLQQSPEAQELYQQFESADEETRSKIGSRLRELMDEFGNG
ncbi:MAG: tetratricopeptide repeat protein [Cyanobacteria bacterium P01_D01_bin.116]